MGQMDGSPLSFSPSRGEAGLRKEIAWDRWNKKHESHESHESH